MTPFRDSTLLTELPSGLELRDDDQFGLAYGDLFEDALRALRVQQQAAQPATYTRGPLAAGMGTRHDAGRALGQAQGRRQSAFMLGAEDFRRQMDARRRAEMMQYAQQRIAEREQIRAFERALLGSAAGFHQEEAANLGETLLSMVSFGGGG